MPAAFPRTFAALRDDRGRRLVVAIVIALGLLGGWIAWSAIAKVSVYRTSAKARVEVSPAPARIVTLAAGRVTAAHLEVGATVKAGDVLVELEATPERLAAERARTRVETLAPEVASIERELAIEDEAVLHGGVADLEAERESVARMRSVDADLGLAEQQYAREHKLTDAGASAKEQLDRARAELRKQRSELTRARHEADALVAANRERAMRRRARKEQLDRQHAELASQLAAARAESERLDFDLSLRTIRAPIDGVLGDVGTLRAGSVVREGELIASIVPAGELHVVADYDAAAFGRLAVAQRGRMRVAGFPWTRYGTVAVRVARVASEVRDGTIRVELVLEASPRIPLRHGMTGEIDIEVDRATPLALLLHTIGEGLD